MAARSPCPIWDWTKGWRMPERLWVKQRVTGMHDSIALGDCSCYSIPFQNFNRKSYKDMSAEERRLCRENSVENDYPELCGDFPLRSSSFGKSDPSLQPNHPNPGPANHQFTTRLRLDLKNDCDTVFAGKFNVNYNVLPQMLSWVKCFRCAKLE